MNELTKFDLLRIGQWFYIGGTLYKKIRYENGDKMNAENVVTGEQVQIALTTGVRVWTHYDEIKPKEQDSEN